MTIDYKLDEMVRKLLVIEKRLSAMLKRHNHMVQSSNGEISLLQPGTVAKITSWLLQLPLTLKNVCAYRRGICFCNHRFSHSANYQ